MGDQVALCVAALMVGIAYFVPRSYYRWRARRADPQAQPFQASTESKLRLVLMGLSGVGMNLLTLLWLINPAWVRWSALPLPDWLRWIGVALGGVAVALAYLAHRALGDSFTPTLMTRQEHYLVTSGVYRWVRHPVYGSYFTSVASSFLLTSNWLVGFLGSVYLLLIAERTGHEERMMLDEFGDEYREYMQRTGRYFPRLLSR
jgi:protein-S-isoprenylcysteine O-methyltransferase Ste14